MYKRFNLQELKTVQNTFLSNFCSIIRKEKCQTPTDFFKKMFKEGSEIYYLNRGDFLFRIQQQDNDILLMDEKEKIQVVLDEQGQREFQSLVKNYIIKRERTPGQKSIENILLDAFHTGEYGTIGGKKYLVYDIETIGSLENLKEMKFTVGYAMEPNEQNKMTYEYIDIEHLGEFVDKMLAFDGYIVGFNNIRFDNPVCMYNTGKSEEDLKKLNDKSIDLFVFIHAVCGKRLGLNKVSESLVGVSKTLSSGAEGEKLYQQFLDTGDEQILETLKQYCKNDVRMTALVFLYLMHFKKVFMEDDEINFTLEDLIQKSHTQIKEDAKTMMQQGIFS